MHARSSCVLNVESQKDIDDTLWTVRDFVNQVVGAHTSKVSFARGTISLSKFVDAMESPRFDARHAADAIKRSDAAGIIVQIQTVSLNNEKKVLPDVRKIHFLVDVVGKLLRHSKKLQYSRSEWSESMLGFISRKCARSDNALGAYRLKGHSV